MPSPSVRPKFILGDCPSDSCLVTSSLVGGSLRWSPYLGGSGAFQSVTISTSSKEHWSSVGFRVRMTSLTPETWDLLALTLSFLFLFLILIYLLFLVVLDLHCCTWAFSTSSMVVSLVAEHGL